MTVPLPNLTLAAPSTATSGATVNAPFAVGGSASTGLTMTTIALFGIGALLLFKILRQ